MNKKIIIDKFMSWFLSPAVAMIWASLDDPVNWRFETYTITHFTGVELWIENGAWFLDGSHETPKFVGLLERHILWFKFRSIRKLLVHSKILAQLTRIES